MGPRVRGDDSIDYRKESPMPSAHVALRSAIHDALIADTALTSALGGAHVYDEPPRNAAFPYVTLGEARIVDAAPMTARPRNIS